ncbi:MAG: ferredoxin:thioredoxin reductase [Spirochaetales bacterium]|nr:ferredoxin:thioredoxin reductase [Spirochaetales bacterium]
MTEEQVRIFMSKTAEKKGWHLTPDTEHLGYMAEGFMINTERYGYLQCPCRDSWGERKKDKDILCPCDYAPADIEEFGQCFCGLYLDEEVFEKGGATGSIPERRDEERFPD